MKRKLKTNDCRVDFRLILPVFNYVMEIETRLEKTACERVLTGIPLQRLKMDRKITGIRDRRREIMRRVAVVFVL